ncbi:MAG: UDP-glucose/GDP-mannose dehydrogenase family protein [Nanoarchaeota archaeon]|nr:UDP-glucose/GDP-mannose dehydrogenase family protein [Nanoarchaeota archaeon]
MKLAFFGTGYVGLVTGTCFAELGNDVLCVDIDKTKIENLKKGIIPIYEPGLSEMVKRNVSEERLGFTLDAKQAIETSDILFIAVGTPPKEDGHADMSFIFQVAETIGTHMTKPKIIAIKSTVPVGTANKVKGIIGKQTELDFEVISNPEFLREGQAIYDFMHPDKVILGGQDEVALATMTKLYKPLERPNQPIMVTNNVNAELIKYANNSFLATKISFMNELSNLCEEIKGDIKVVGRAIGLDNRIGPRFLQAGPGYGGSCFPKDIRALIATMKENKVPAKLLGSVHEVNEDQKKSLLKKLKQLIPTLKGQRIAIWGLSFKPKTDDIREAASVVFIDYLLKEEASVCAFDPQAMKNMEAIYPDITFAGTPYEALKGADALVILTEWDEFRQLDMERIKALLKKPIIFDARNIYSPEEMREQGFTYRGIGR